jgi:hypothetical protein
VIVCTYEDRPSALVGTKLLVLSLEAHCSGLEIEVNCPCADDAFRAWIGRRSNTRLSEELPAGLGWNAKPTLLQRKLDEGYDQAIWFDSDIVATSDFRTLLADWGPDEIGVTEDHAWQLFGGGTIRTELWGLTPGRSLPCTVNSGVVRVTPAHRQLLEAWQLLLADGPYLRAQERTMWERPIHLIGDQDVITALLGAARFADVPIRWLRRGKDIAQWVGPAGYTVGERLRNVGRGLPPLVHGIDPKPWTGGRQTTGWWGWYNRVAIELSPYTWASRRHRAELDEDAQWMDRRTLTAGLCRLLTLDEPNLQGIPQAMFHGAMRRAKHAAGKRIWPDERAHVDPDDQPRGDEVLAALDAAPGGERPGS